MTDSSDASGAAVIRATAKEARAPDSLVHATSTGLGNAPPHGAGAKDVADSADSRLETPARRRSGLPKGTGQETRRDAASTPAVATLLSRLERTFATGDLAGLAGFFTANAVVNDGVGGAAIRQVYADRVGQAGKGRIALSGLGWRAGQHGKLRGLGTLRIGTRRESQRDLGDVAGTVEIELVPWMGDHRIAKLIYRASP